MKAQKKLFRARVNAQEHVRLVVRQRAKGLQVRQGVRVAQAHAKAGAAKDVRQLAKELQVRQDVQVAQAHAKVDAVEDVHQLVQVVVGVAVLQDAQGLVEADVHQDALEHVVEVAPTPAQQGVVVLVIGVAADLATPSVHTDVSANAQDMDTEVLVAVVTGLVLHIVQQLVDLIAIVHAKTWELTEQNKHQSFLLFIFETKWGTPKTQKRVGGI